MKEAKIPNPDSISKLAEFWDEHDLTEYHDKLEEVSEIAFNRSGHARNGNEISPQMNTDEHR